MSPTYVTIDKVENIVIKAIQEYEREVVEPRHQENMKALQILQRNVWVGYGIVIAVVFFVHLLWK